MNLFAYSQVETLESIAKQNDIRCPRLRGYSLMRDERPVDPEIFRHEIELYIMRNLCESQWGSSSVYVGDETTDAKCRYHIKYFDCWYLSKDDPNYHEPEIRWDRLNGKKKRIFITRVKNQMNAFKQQYAAWNKYVGRDDILYIHARIGGGNWPEYYTDVVDKPWFIEKVDDAYDSTYCDIYAKIEPCIEEVPEVDESEV